jgi:hypothetical protein
MYKTLCAAAILLAAIVFTSGNNAVHASAPTITSPVIVASGSLVNQTRTIQKTVLFTPTETGLYRISAYMTLTRPISTYQIWSFFLSWTDDAGAEFGDIVDLYTNNPPPGAWGHSGGFNPGGVSLFEAVAGQPVSYSVIVTKGSPTNGTYSLYYVVEQLE